MNGARALGLGLMLLLLAPTPAGAAEQRVWVLDGSGRPRPGAELIRAAPPVAPGKPVLFDGAANAVARADAKGWIAIPPGPRGMWIVRAPGLAPALVPSEGGASLTVRLLPARAIQGRVRLATPAQTPVPLEVFALPDRGGEVMHKVVAGDDGTYRFAALHDGSWMLAVRRPGGRLISLGRVQAGSSAGDRQVDFDRSVTGVLLDADKAETGVAGRTVALLPEPDDGRSVRSAVSDDKGRFAFAGVPPGLYVGRIDGADWAFESDPPRVVVGSGDPPAEAEWYLVRCLSLRGSLRAPDGKPVSGARVALVSADRDQGRATVTSNEQGAFVFGNVRPAEGYRLVVHAEGLAVWVGDPFDVARVSDTTLDPIQLDPGWTLEVVVNDPDGKALGDVDVVAQSARRPSWQHIDRRATTDANGVATIADLPNDDVIVTVSGRNWLTRVLRVEHPRTEDRRREALSLDPAPHLEGVVGPEGRGGGLAIEVRSRDDGHRTRAESDAQGRFRIDHLRPTAYDVEVRRPTDGRLLARVEHVLPANEEPLNIQLPELQRIEGRVFGLEEGGGPAVVVVEAPVLDRDLGRYVWLREREAPVASAGREGSFSVDAVRPGAYTLRVWQGGRATSAVPVLVEDFAVEGIALRMEDAARLAGYVFGEDGRPRRVVRVTAEPLRGDGAMRAPLSAAREQHTDDDGLFAFESLAPGLWRVTVRVEAHAPLRRTLRIVAGESVVMDDLQLTEGVHLRGRVTDMQQDPLHGLRVAARRMDGSGRPHEAFTDAEGGYDIPNLAPGMYLVRITGIAPDLLAADEAAIEVGSRDLTLDFVPGEGAELDAVVARAGKPVPGALVELISVPDLAEGVIAWRRRVQTDRDGRAHFEALEPGRYHVALEVGALRTERTIDLTAHDRIELDLEAYEGRLRGRVFAPGGKPVPGARVEARSRVDPDVVAETFTNGEGHFVLTGIPIGAYDVLVGATGLPPTRLSPAQAELAGSDFPYDVELGAGGNLVITVVDRHDAPVVGAQVFVESDDGVALHRWPFAANQDGEAHARGMPPGVVRVRVRARGYASSEPMLVTVADGATTERRVVLGPPGALRVVVLGAALDPIPRVRIDVVHATSKELAAYRRPLRRLSAAEAGVVMPRAGAVTLDDLQPGAYEVRVDAGARYRSVARPVQVVVGGTATIEVQLEAK